MPEVLEQLDPGARELLTRTVADGPLTRAEMTSRTGWARTTVTARLAELDAHDLLRGEYDGTGRRGRPALRYGINPDRASLLVADVGAHRALVARADLVGNIQGHTERKVAVGDGPDAVLAILRAAMDELGAGEPIWGVGIGLPGPVEFHSGRVVSPPIMRGWDGVEVPRRIAGWYGDAVTFVDNDVNARALAELAPAGNAGRARRGDSAPAAGVESLLVLKLATGVGAGLVVDGRVVRGSAGAAGDLGHTWAEVPPARRAPVPECVCGKSGCVEAYAGGWALARALSELHGRTIDVDGAAALLAAGDADAVRLVREAAYVLGGSVATAVSLINPSAIVLSGQIAVAAGDHLLAGMRELIYARALPLATRDLAIRLSTLGRDGGVIGLARGLAQRLLIPAS